MTTKKIEGSFPEDSYPCDSCKHDPEPWDSEACDGCCKAHSGYEPKTESSTVSLGVFEQVKWERDVAIEQLKELGYSLGEKPKTGEWQQDRDGTYLCSECGSGFKEQPTLMGKPMFLYCPLCGVRMKKGEENE